MNKKIMALCLAAALSAAPIAVFAEAEDVVNDSTMPIASPEEGEQREVAFVSQTATVKNVTKEDDGTYFVECEDENKEPMHVRISSESKTIFDNAGKVLKAEDVKEGDEITIYNGANKPMLMIYPPQYTPDVLIVNNKEINSSATVDKFVVNGGDDTSLINTFGTLVLNIGTDDDSATEVVDLEGNNVSRSELDGRNLCVFYSMTTFSIPPQTPPEKIVVLPKEEPSEDVDDTLNKDDTENKPDETPAPVEITRYLVINGKELDINSVVKMGEHTMLPVRAVAETMGLEVAWDNELMSVAVGTIPMGVNFRIDVDSYNKSRMTPFTFGQAPVLINDVTYVPVEFFTEILEAEITSDGEKTIINY